MGDFEEASRDGLEGPELGEPEALEVDDDERLAHRPAGGGRRGWEDLGEESLDADEHGAPVLLRRDVSVEPLVAYRAEALDVYRTPELYDAIHAMERSHLSHTRWKDGNGKRKAYLVGLTERTVMTRACVWAKRNSGRSELCAHLVEAHRPALRDVLPPGELCDKRGRRRSDTLRGQERGRGCEGGWRPALRTSKGSMRR